MEIKVSDYIVEFLIEKKITDVFGYPGGMVTHLMESFYKYRNKISAHVNYHEQASSFSACGYAQVSHKLGVAYATSGPGATNLITGICNAYFDSIPTIFITGQVNVKESKKDLNVRQKGFQETNICDIVKNITKYSVCVGNRKDIKYILEKAYSIAMEGRPGPVLVDIPMNIFSETIEIDEIKEKIFKNEEKKDFFDINLILTEIKKASRPCFLIGAGIKMSGSVLIFNDLLKFLNIPVVSSILAIDVLSKKNKLNYGFIGAYGDRVANFIIAKSDLIISLGSRMDIRQTGAKKECFAPNAKIIRVDIDNWELENKVKPDEISINIDVKQFLFELNLNIEKLKALNFNKWVKICDEIKIQIQKVDNKISKANKFIQEISKIVPNNRIITTDVGQNQIWVAQSFQFKNNQKILFSGGHGAMGYSLPAAIGAYYASRKPVVCFTGDGGFLMNIQELQFISREKIPITVIVMNNYSLGMIRHFQEMYFNENFFQTVKEKGYTVPNFELIAKSYNLKYKKITKLTDIKENIFKSKSANIIEIELKEKTYVYPKLEFGKPNQDQEPLIDRNVYNYLMSL